MRRKLILRNSGDFVIHTIGESINLGDYLEAIVIEPMKLVLIDSASIGIRVTCSAIGEIEDGLDYIVTANVVKAHLRTLTQGDEIILRSMQYHDRSGHKWSWPRLPMLKNVTY